MVLQNFLSLNMFSGDYGVDGTDATDVLHWKFKFLLCMKKLEDHTNSPNCGKLTLVLLILTLRRWMENVYLHSREL